MDKSVSWLQCMDCGYIADLYDTRIFRCPECYDPSNPRLWGLYDVEHHIPSKPIDEWKNLFDSRMKTRTSGVWQFREWIMPSVEPKEIVRLGEGLAPIVPIGNNLRRWLGAKRQDIRFML